MPFVNDALTDLVSKASGLSRPIIASKHFSRMSIVWETCELPVFIFEEENYQIDSVETWKKLGGMAFSTRKVEGCQETYIITIPFGWHFESRTILPGVYLQEKRKVRGALNENWDMTCPRGDILQLELFRRFFVCPFRTLNIVCAAVHDRAENDKVIWNSKFEKITSADLVNKLLVTEQISNLLQEATAWLDRNFPRWHDAFAYWEEEIDYS